jgi:hypothetical protein
LCFPIQSASRPVTARSAVSCLEWSYDNHLCLGNTCPACKAVSVSKQYVLQIRLFTIPQFEKVSLKWQRSVNTPVTFLIWTLLIFSTSEFPLVEGSLKKPYPFLSR